MTPKILSVDDSKTIRLVLARLLRPFQCDLLEAANGAEGLEVVAREKPDLIILDYNMPVMDGAEMLRRLRAEADLKRTPVLVLTAQSSPEAIATMARLAVRDYVIKPFRDEELLAKVGRIIRLVPRTEAGAETN